MNTSTKNRILAAINTVVPLQDYEKDDCIFSQKYALTPVAVVYLLQELSKNYQFAITEDFVDALEYCTFGRLEELLEQYVENASA